MEPTVDQTQVIWTVNAPESGSENQSSPTSIVADVNKVSNEYYK